MYYRKYFEGAVENTNETKYVTLNGTTAKQYCYTNQMRVVNEAIKDTLLSAGIACEYDNATCTLFIKGLPVQVLIQYQTGLFNLYEYGNSTALVSTATSYPMFSGVNYKFYVTLKGDPESLLKIMVGTYSQPALETIGFVLMNVADLRDRSKWMVLAKISYNNGTLHKAGGEKHGEIDSITFGVVYIKNEALSKSGLLVPLAECIDTTGFFKGVNCYVGNQALVADQFYRIGGEIYYNYANYILAKCTTEIP